MPADQALLDLLARGRKAWVDARSNTDDEPPDLSGTDLRSFRLVLFDLAGASLQNANLTGVHLEGAVLDRANLDRALLRKANLGGVRLRNASLRQANLRGADLSDANFEGADLEEADLRGARLNKTRLVGANLSNALVDRNLERAILLDSRIVWPRLSAAGRHQLKLRVVPNDVTPDWPTVQVLIDGQDVLGLEGHQGFDPEKIFSINNPLLPTDPPRRIAIYRCRCGEAGCSVIAPTIVHRATEIVWRDFRDVTGVYVGPEVDGDPPAGTDYGIPEIVFDAEQYRTEVERASADRSWETPGRTVSRLVMSALRTHSARLESRGYRIASVDPYSDGSASVRMHLVRDHVAAGTSIIRVSQPDGDPAEVASGIVRQLTSTDPTNWDAFNY